ncbi:MAG: hypothetical protein PHT07_21695 [Paludibacter sp.]|nr:hypothetical protein [Paludibacter sp.]
MKRINTVPGFPTILNDTQTSYLARYFASDAGRKLSEKTGIKDLADMFSCSQHTIRVAIGRSWAEPPEPIKINFNPLEIVVGIPKEIPKDQVDRYVKYKLAGGELNLSDWMATTQAEDSAKDWREAGFLKFCHDMPLNERDLWKDLTPNQIVGYLKLRYANWTIERSFKFASDHNEYDWSKIDYTWLMNFAIYGLNEKESVPAPPSGVKADAATFPWWDGPFSGKELAHARLWNSYTGGYYMKNDFYRSGGYFGEITWWQKVKLAWIMLFGWERVPISAIQDPDNNLMLAAEKARLKEQLEARMNRNSQPNPVEVHPDLEYDASDRLPLPEIDTNSFFFMG